MLVSGALQMVSLAMLLYISHGATDTLAIVSATAGPALLGVAAALTVWSLVVYMKVRATLQHPRETETERDRERVRETETDTER